MAGPKPRGAKPPDAKPPDAKPPDADMRAGDMKLLETGNFADAEVICGDKTFKIHRAVVCTRSVWFEKALAGPFKASTPRRQLSHANKSSWLIIRVLKQEATSGKVNIEENDPAAIEVALKYIYGGVAAVNMAEETSNQPVIQFCVNLFRAADFLLLQPMLQIIQRRLGDYCDEKLKWLCTRGNVELDKTDRTATQWTVDLVRGIHLAYKWNIHPIKKTLMEFVWVGRRALLGKAWICIHDDLDSTPAFIKDMIRHCTLFIWQKNSAWAPNAPRGAFPQRLSCARCNKALVKWQGGNSDAYGQVFDPFTISGENSVRREWCKECAALDMIPWRENRS